MAGSANALQSAIFSRLTGDATLTGMIGAGAIFDRRLTGKAMPYVVLSEVVTSDFGPDAEEHLVTVEAWSDAEGRKQAQEIAAQVKVLLDGTALSLAGFVLVNLMHRSTRARREPKTRAHVARMEFRAVTE
ncbi:DUF3168 domain-containing protein [Rhizobium sp. LjRoot254]|uniref:DUF3168 domain-containing protein n=1 Tax=Rhizobium sp. LjRoot254 TaxID=3342297 RepID=UPI003ECE2420